MNQPPHILIIGAGLIGLATARACINRGARVSIIEKQAHIGCGAGFANSGMIHPSQAWPWVAGGMNNSAQLAAARDVAALSHQAAGLLKQRMNALSLADINRNQGCYQIFDDEALRNIYAARYEHIGTAAEKQTHIARPALYFPDDFSGSAYAWSRAEAAALIAEGVRIKTQITPSLKPAQHGAAISLNGEDIKADHIILCAGHRSNLALKPVGLHLPITPIRGFSLDFDASNIDLSPLPNAPVMDTSSRTALTRFGRVIRLSGSLGAASAQPLWQRWCQLIPDIMQALPRPDRVWSGDRPVSLLGRPIISESPIKGLWVNSGHGHMGWTLSMASGELIAQMIFDGQSAPAFSWPNIDA
jgi:D-amino-acid dehydrogenase